MIQTENIRYGDGDEMLNGVFVWDATTPQKRYPGILVIHGGAGLDDHARGRARRFAEAGFVAFACDMYGESVRGNRDRVMQHIGELRRDRTVLRRRAQAAIDQLASHSQVDGRMAAVGYCLGGMVGLELARSGIDLAGVVSVHGGLETTRQAEPSTIRARILVCHGVLDPHVPMAHVTAFTEEMNRAGADYQLIVYGGAMHGFTHETATQPLNGVAYNATADARSSRVIQTFLDELFTRC
jgi:dienelactone hydrolase